MAKRPAKQPKKPLPHWLNQTNAAAGHDVSVQAFVRWGVQPVAKIAGQTYYTPKSIADFLVGRSTADLREKLTRLQEDTKVTESDREKMLLTREQRIGQELKNAQARRELAPIGVIDWTLAKVSTQIAAILESVPMKVKQLLPKMTAAEIGLIEREIIKVQNAAASITVDFDEYDREREPTGARESDPVGTQNA